MFAVAAGARSFTTRSSIEMVPPEASSGFTASHERACRAIYSPMAPPAQRARRRGLPRIKESRCGGEAGPEVTYSSGAERKYGSRHGRKD